MAMITITVVPDRRRWLIGEQLYKVIATSPRGQQLIKGTGLTLTEKRLFVVDIITTMREHGHICDVIDEYDS